jgi:hypothetical protein
LRNKRRTIVETKQYREGKTILGTFLQSGRFLSDVLNERHEKIIRLRYGLDSTPQLTLLKIGTEFHLTKERIRQIINWSLKRLQFSMLPLDESKDSNKYGFKPYELETPRDMKLTFRARALLYKLNIHTSDELTRLSEDDLLKHRNCGRKTLRNIQVELRKLGKDLKKWEREEYEEKTFLDGKIPPELNVRNPIKWLLYQNGFKTLDGLVKLKPYELRKFHGFGPKNYEVIHNELLRLGKDFQGK